MSLWWWLLWTQPAVPMTWTNNPAVREGHEGANVQWEMTFSADSASMLEIDRTKSFRVYCNGHPDGTLHAWDFDLNGDLIVMEKAP